MPPHATLFELLDEDWEHFANSGGAASTIARWAEAEPGLRGLTSPAALLAALQGRTEPRERDRRFLAVLRLARRDDAARRLALHVVRPALATVARSFYGRWGAHDASSTVIVLALERIANFPTERRTTNLAGQIVFDVRHDLHEMLQRELAHESVFSFRRDFTDIEEDLVAGPERTAADRVRVIVNDAVRSGKISPRHAELVLASRLDGVPLKHIARAWRRPPQTVRRMRQRVERALIDVAVA
jgi:hypothetical protein